jgi:uncharacterized protein (TIGR02271 family)
MNLIRLDKFYPNYREELFDGEDIKGVPIYAGRTEEKIGTVDNVLVDETGQFRYFVIDTGFWIFGKKVLLPVGQCQIDEAAERLYATGLRTKQQAEALPEYHDTTRIDDGYEEQVRQIYRPSVQPLEVSSPLESPVPVDGPPQSVSSPSPSPRHRYDQEPDLYGMNNQTHQRFKLYEERLITNKRRQKTGEVAVGKHVETETVRASVPIERERVVIERVPTSQTQAVETSTAADFQEGEVARMEIYEETPDIHKEAFVREEVQIRKEVDRETINAQETIRREELNVDTAGQLKVNRPSNQTHRQ